jgi:hypothetical protein
MSTVTVATEGRPVEGVTAICGAALAAGGTGNTALQGFSLAGGRMAVFQLVFHPLQDFDHPFEAAGLVTRLWPEPATELDLSTHAAIDTAAYSALGKLFVRGGGGIGLQPGERVPAQGPWPWDSPQPTDWPVFPGAQLGSRSASQTSSGGLHCLPSAD